ncbi:MAG: cation:proton antiporter [Solirubrobacterales bacterium]
MIAILICLGMAALAAQIGLAAIIGAFLAGMILAETRDQHPLRPASGNHPRGCLRWS